MREPVLVSACLIGVSSRYDGGDALNQDLIKRLDNFILIPVCPEQLGGLGTPRPKAEITSGDGTDVLKGDARVVTEEGTDVTRAFLLGAEEVERIAKLTHAKTAFLKESSPSCGVTTITSGGIRIDGKGVTAALLSRSGIKVKAVP